jgi:CRISPR-associated protein Csb2
MLILEVEYLTGRAVATARYDREQAEWPPHPGRLFSALVAACHEADLTDAEREAGRAALRWLEKLPPPALAVTPASQRDIVPVFVPVNDSTIPEVRAGRTPSEGQIADAMRVLPERRPRQGRTFPSVTPEHPVAHFLWRETDAEGEAAHRPILGILAGHLTYLGHSSSLVRASVCEDVTFIKPTHEPDADGNLVLRVPARGRLDQLERDYGRQSRPSPGTYQAYRELAAVKPVRLTEAASAFGEIIVCRLRGPSFPLAGTLRLTTAVRDALLRQAHRASDWLRELLSGHTADGGLSKNDHVAYVPLANVGSHQHADGLVKGFALVLPRGMGRFSNERREVLRALLGVAQIAFGSQGPWDVDVPAAGEELHSLRPGPYIGPSKTWASVTPLLCDRFPKDKDGQRVEDVIRDSCRRVVGVEPAYIEVSPVSWHRGVPPSHEFGRIRKPEEPPRHRTHAFLAFHQPVRGPILLGAGRYAGLGLFRRWNAKEGRG